MKTKHILAAVSLALTAVSEGQSIVVSSVVDTGLYNVFEMSLNPTTGKIYVNGFASGSSELSIQTVTGSSLAPLYSPLPGTSYGNLGYTNGFAVHGSNLWWNNANSGPGSATEISRAPATGGGVITRTSPTDDLDSLASDGTTLFTAHYTGGLYSVTAGGGLTSLGFYRGTSHLAIGAEAGVLYVADDSGIYRRNTDGSYTNINNAAARYLTNGSRLGVGGGFVYALDRNNHNGFWKIDIVTGAAAFITDPNFINLNAITYYNGDLYVSDTGELAAQPNVSGHVWKISNVYMVSSVVDTGLYNVFEMSLNPSTGGIYVNGFASGSSELSIETVTGASLTTLYSPLPGTSGGNLGYTNGFAVHGSNLWWNNANSGPGSATEISQAPAAGGGAITRTSPTDDLDSLASDGTTLFTAYYAGSLFSVTAGGGLTSLGFHRGTSHLAIGAESGVLYVADDSGIYRRNTDGSYTNINNAAARYLTNGSRLGVGGGFVYALDRSNHNGFWKIDKVTGTATFITDLNFINLNAIIYYNGDLYASDTGELAAQPNVSGHIWKISNVYSLSASADHGTLTGTGSYAAGTMASLGAIADPGYVFSGWSGDATGSDNPVSILMNANKTAIASFGQDTADPDSDGLTNYQEIVIYGSNPNNSDTDSDGFADGYEVNRGFSPTSGTSSPELNMAIYTAVEVEFGAALGRTYRVESSTDLQNWLPVESGIQGTGGQVSRLYSTRTYPQRYFRAVRE